MICILALHYLVISQYLAISKTNYAVIKKWLCRYMVTIVFYSILICRICELSGVYHEGDFRADSAWPYLTFIDSVSQTVSSCVRAHVCVCVHAMSVSSCYECVFMLCVCVHAMHVFMLCVCHECL